MKCTDFVFIIIYSNICPFAAYQSANIYLFQVKNRNVNNWCEIRLKLTKKILEQCHWLRSGVLTVNFERVSHFFSRDSVVGL